MRFKLPYIVSALALCFPGAVVAQDIPIDWIAGPAPANWNVDDNWQFGQSNFVPSAEFDESARINNGGTAVVSSVVPSVLNLTVPNGGVRVEGGGSLEVENDATFGANGLLHLTGDGSLRVFGNAVNSVRITGPDASYQVDGNYGTSNQFISEITGDQHSTVQVGGTATLAGSLQVELVGVAPTLGQSWTLINAGEVNGGFQDISILSDESLPRGLSFRASQTDTDVVLLVDNVLILTVDRLSGAVEIENPVAPIEIKAYSIDSALGALRTADWTSLSSSGAAGPGWETANPRETSISELNLTSATAIAAGDGLALGRPYLPGLIEDLQFEYLTADGEVTQGIIEFTGPASDLVLTVDPNTGEAAISNLSPFITPPTVKAYSIDSAAESLTPSSWLSLEDSGDAGPGWQRANPQTGHLSELNLTGSTEFTLNSLIPIGNILAQDAERDLVFEYLTETGEVLLGTVEYGEIPRPTLVCGDFDMDGDVDSADRTIQTTNWTGALPPGDPGATKTFAQGDCDGDGDVDTADQNGTITNWTGAMNPAGNLEDGADANLIYDPATGNVKLDAGDTASGMFISFVLGTGDNNMRPENLVESAPGNAGPFFDVGTNTDATTFQIGQTDPLNQGAGPVIDLGDVFPPGIRTVEELSEYLTLAEYASELGSGGTFDLNVIPEPSSLGLTLFGLLLFCVRRGSIRF